MKALLKMNAALVTALALAVGGYLLAKGRADILRMVTSDGAELGALIWNTIVTVIVSTLAATATGFAAALGLVGWLPRGSRTGRAIFALIDLGAALPAIVYGLFGFAVFCQHQMSLRAGIATLSFMLAPMLAGGFTAALRGLDPALAESAAALGLSRRAVILRVLVPAAWPALAASAMAALGRGLADAGLLLFVAGTSPRLAGAFLEMPGATLSVRVFELALNEPGKEGEAFATAAILFFLSLGAQAALASFSKQRTPNP